MGRDLVLLGDMPYAVDRPASRRCGWCGVFVRRDQPLTAWRVRVGPGHRQDPHSPWNYWARLLCPDHSAAIHVPPIWERVTVGEVLRQRGVLRAPVDR